MSPTPDLDPLADAERTDVSLADLTTLRLGGPAKRLVEASSSEDLCEIVAACDRVGEPVLVLGGGSNLVVADAGFAGTVCHVTSRGVHVESADACSGVTVRVAAGESWDEFVAYAVAEEWVGVEALSGIPGLAGAAPIQNVGAYGQEVADTIAQVRVWDRVENRTRTFALADCGFGYRTSLFKQTPGRYVVLETTYQFRQGSLGAPVRYAELARALGVERGERAPLGEVRSAVLALRDGKGMLLDVRDHDTWSAGSFFTNPILPLADAQRLPEDAPRFPAPEDSVKTSAAWLIEHAGFAKGYGADLGRGVASLSTKHTLALTNRGGASTEELLTVARAVRDGVRDRFGITLEPEPVLLGCAL